MSLATLKSRQTNLYYWEIEIAYIAVSTLTRPRAYSRRPLPCCTRQNAAFD